MRKHIPVAALHTAILIIEPTVGMAAVLPIHIWAGITGASVVATI